MVLSILLRSAQTETIFPHLSTYRRLIWQPVHTWFTLHIDIIIVSAWLFYFFLKHKKNNSGINVMHRENDVFSASQQTTLQTKTI